MSISRFFNETATQQRLTTSESSGRTIEDWQTLGTLVCNIQPLSLELVTTGEGHFGNTHTIFCPQTESVQEGDRLIIDTIIYQAQAVQDNDYGNNRINHLKISAIEIE